MNTLPATSQARLSAGAAFACLTLSLNAQSQPEPQMETTASPSEPPSEEVVQLSVFEVNTARDVGYRAGTTLAGTRIGEELKNIPQTISVLTPDFIKDIAATDTFDAMKFAIGGAYKPTNSFNVNTFVFRGVVNSFQSRNYFLWYNPSDGFSTERIDVVRGPNAILFGDADPGGMMNINTKRALFNDSTAVSVKIGSWNNERGTLDINRVITSKWAARINLVYEEKDNWQHWVGQRRKGIHFTTTWQPTTNMHIRLEGEYQHMKRRVPQTIPVDQYTHWDGETPYVYNSENGPTGTLRLNSAKAASYWVWDNTTGELKNWKGFGQTGGLPDTQSKAVKDSSIFERGSHFYGPAYSHNYEFNTETLTLEQKAGPDLTIQATGNMTFDTNYRTQTANGLNVLHRDPNPTLPGGGANPHFGDYYLDYQWQAARAHHYIPEGRLNIVYDWQPVSWMKQRLFGGLSVRKESFNNTQQREVIVNNPSVPKLNDASVQVYRRVYLEDGDDLSVVGNRETFTDPTTGYTSGFRTTNATNRNDTYTSNAQLNASGEYLGGKLRSLLGVRRDYYRGYTQTGVRNSVGLNDRTGVPSVLAIEGYNTAFTTGGIWQPKKELTFYVTRSGSYRPRGAGAVLIDGSPIGAQLGSGEEAGFRVDLKGGKFYVQACVFDIKESNIVTSEIPITAINSIWTALGQTDNEVSTSTSDTSAVRSKGWELETWVNLVPGWTLQFGYGFADPKSSDLTPATLAYINQNMGS